MYKHTIHMMCISLVGHIIIYPFYFHDMMAPRNITAIDIMYDVMYWSINIALMGLFITSSKIQETKKYRVIVRIFMSSIAKGYIALVIIIINHITDTLIIIMPILGAVILILIGFIIIKDTEKVFVYIQTTKKQIKERVYAFRRYVNESL